MKFTAATAVEGPSESNFGSAKTLNTIHGAHERNLNYAQLELGAS